VTVSGAVPRPGVREIEYGLTIAEIAALAGTAADGSSAVLVGGYFGGWASLDEVRDRPLDPADRAAGGLGFGCGVVSFAGPDTCGVRATAEIMTFMAGESAAQCGPCVFGLAAIAEATRRLATGAAADDDLERIDRWAGQVQGRGACHHPDGAIGLLRSARAVFADEFARHQARGRCSVADAAAA
jgi:NADH:ubiquinone oxidoreductase subunit F (NADH-binding)